MKRLQAVCIHFAFTFIMSSVSSSSLYFLFLSWACFSLWLPFTQASPILSSSSSNYSASADFSGQFWAGADVGTLIRMENIPGRVFYNLDGKTIKDPFHTLADAGINVIRVEGQRGQCLGPTKFVNDKTTLGKELVFGLDWGCLDVQVKTAQRGAALGMRIVLTINQGLNIPSGMESYTYAQMVAEVQKEARRQLQPFLAAKILPDVILLENEGSDGFLFHDNSTGHDRGVKSSKISAEQINKELCGQIPTGNMASYPQYAGYLKAEILACNEAISAAGLSTETVRYGLHSHAQYVQWKEGVVHGPNPPSESALKDSAGNTCSAQVIPKDILAHNASTMMTIAGFSAYPDPMTPTDIDSETAMEAMLERPVKTLEQLQSYAQAYGKYEQGPFKGQYKLQGLGVEWATRYAGNQIPQEVAMTEMMWKKVKAFDAFLGVMWWEPWYCYNDWEGGDAAMCRKFATGAEGTGEAPTELLRTWGAAAVSPWKRSNSTHLQSTTSTA